MRALALTVAGLAACSYHGRDVSDGGAGGGDGPGGVDAVSRAWWDPAWPTRLPLTIANTAAEDLPAGYQVGFAYAIDAGPCAGPRDNLRVVRGAELDRVIDELPGDEWIWFALARPIPAGATSTDYWLYCGNPSPPPAPSDPAAVFVFHDDFARTALGPDWTPQSSVTLDGATVTLGGNDSGIITNQTFGPGHAIDYVVRPTDAGSAELWAGFQNGFPDQPPWLHWWTMNAYEVRPDYWASQSGTVWYGNPVALDTSFHQYGVENYPDRSAYRYDGPIVEEHVYDLPPDPAQLNARLHNNTSTSFAVYDWVRVRLAIHPQPTITVGAPESGP